MTGDWKGKLANHPALSKDGGPAFPTSHRGGDTELSLFGMSLRDWFAGQALAASMKLAEEHDENPDRLPALFGFDDVWLADAVFGDLAVTIAYEIADAMLKQRERQES